MRVHVMHGLDWQELSDQGTGRIPLNPNLPYASWGHGHAWPGRLRCSPGASK